MTKSVEMQHTDVREYLPHRYPFLLVDKVIETVPDQHIVATKAVTCNEPFFQGHFPSKPVMPGVLMIEALAQASGILIYRSLGRKPTLDSDLFYLAGVDNTRYKRMVVPGDMLELRVEVLRKKMTIWRFKGTASVDGEVACSTEFMCIKGSEE